MTLPQPSGGFEWTQEPWGPALRCAPLNRVATHLFTIGNLRLVDDPEEWRRVAERIGVAPSGIRLIRQVHGVAVAVVRNEAAHVTDERPEADIIISDDPQSAIGVRTADCAAVLLADRRTGAVGAAHAGWRGAARRAAAVAVDAMRDAFGSDPRDLVAAIGPCLGPCCGEVGPDVVQAFRAAGHSSDDVASWFSPGRDDRSYLDLWAVNRAQLVRAGVPEPQVHAAALCTRTHSSLMHSYRADGRQAGRMVGLIRAAITGEGRA